MKKSGSSEVLWSDGVTIESKTVRVIGAFPRGGSARLNGTAQSKQSVNDAIETVVYKKIGDLDVHADIYYTAESDFSNKEIPIGTY
jgi:hypothetical protein